MAAPANRRADGAQSHQSTIARAWNVDHNPASRSVSSTPSRAISNRRSGGAESNGIRSTSRRASRLRLTDSAGRRCGGTPDTPMSRSLDSDPVPLADDPKTTARQTSGSACSAEWTAVKVSTGRFYSAPRMHAFPTLPAAAWTSHGQRAFAWPQSVWRSASWWPCRLSLSGP